MNDMVINNNLIIVKIVFQFITIYLYTKNNVCFFFSLYNLAHFHNNHYF